MSDKKDKVCPLCYNHAHFKFTKKETDYHQCTNCKTIFSAELDNDNLIGGGAEIERNTQQNHLRIERIDTLCAGMKKEDVYILDWGCGHAYLIEDLKKAGYVNSYGYDLYNPEYQAIPPKDTFHIVVSVECFEHMAGSFMEIDAIHRMLKNGGYCYIETGFLNAAWDEGLADEDNPYINPDAGHSTIFTHHGIDVLMARKNFTPMDKFNRHCHLYKKVIKK
jgi:SAM-dependent methyltransferase